MNKKISGTLLALFMFQLLAAQHKPKSSPGPAKVNKPKGTAIFDHTTFTFGQIEELAGKVRAQFRFTNIGKGDLLIRSVESSCGCTAPDWPKEAIKPGESGAIMVEYDPYNRVGEFYKTLTVNTDGDPQFYYLSVKGEVYQVKLEIRTMFPVTQGNLRFSTVNLNVNPIKENKKDSVKFTVYNNSKREMSIRRIETPPFIKAKVYNELLMPGDVTDVVYYYDAAKANDLGPRRDETYIYTSDDTLPRKIVTVRSDILQDFESIPENEKKNPPKVEIAEPVWDFGEVYLGEVVSHEFTFLNKGKSPLRIRKTASSCGCTAGEFTKDPIGRNKKGKVKVTFNAKNLRGLQDKTINVYFNDPAMQVITLRVKAKVVIPGIDPISGK